MRKALICFMVLVLMSYSASVIAETWECPFCGNEATGNYCNICGMQSPLDSWICIQCKEEKTGNFCNECGSPRPTPISTIKVSDDIENNLNNEETVELTSEDQTDGMTKVATVKNYVGRNLSSCGYTSLGGERRDRYADTTILLVLIDLDSNYIDPKDTSAIGNYKVVAQYPAANTVFNVTTDEDGEVENLGYDEIVLVVTNSDKKADTLKMTNVRPSPDKSIQYVRDYRGRMLENVGYTSLGGKRYDKYGPEGYIEIIIVDEQGVIIDPLNYADFIYYIVLDQDVAPDTEVRFFYTTDETGSEKCSDQSIDIIQITVKLTDQGREVFEGRVAEEEELRKEGKIHELYQGSYEIGNDLPSGNYEFSLISTSCSIYVYNNKTSFENNKGDWKYLYGSGDREYLYLTEGMYLKVSGGATEAKIRDVKLNDSEYMLYTGVYHIGVDLDAGSYELKPYTDASSVYLYQTLSAYNKSKDGKWMYLYGKDDNEYIVLRDGMVLKVSSGATLAKKK